MEANRNAVHIFVELPSSKRSMEKMKQVTIWVSIAITLVSISAISALDNYYQDKLAEAHQAGANSCHIDFADKNAN